MIQPKTKKCLKCRAASVRPVCLPKTKRDKNYIKPGTKAWVTGWGDTRFQQGITTTLRKAKTKLAGHGTCKDFYDQNANPFPISEDQICAEDDVGPCAGDSGGPLMVKNVLYDKRFILVGLVSWGQGCGVSGSYGVYADVLHHLDWIYDSCSRWN